MQKHNPLATGISLLFLGLLLASLAVRFWANDRAWQQTGPTHLAAKDGHVYLYAAGDLFHLTFEGELLGIFPGEVTGLDDDPIDLRVIEKNQLLIAEQEPALIRVCNTKTWDCSEIAASQTEQLARQFKVLPDDSRARWLLTDSPGDTLWGFGKDGSMAQRLVPDTTLAGPNDLAFDEDGHLWVADTDHRRLVELIPTRAGQFETGREHSAQNYLTVAERFYPLMLARAQNGMWWITQASEFSDGYADLVVYDPELGAFDRIQLPSSVFATDIAAAGVDMLVSDFEQFTVFRINSVTHEISVFGDAKFTSRMSALKERTDYYLRLSGIAMAGVFIFAALMIGAAVLATPKSKRWTPQPKAIDFDSVAETVPVSRGVHWLERTPAIERSIKWLELLSFGAAIAILTGLLAMYGWTLMTLGPDPTGDVKTRLDELGWLLMIAGIAVVFSIPMVRFALRPMKRKLGTDGRQIFIRLEDGRELAVKPEQLVYSDRAVLYRQYSMPLLTGKRQSIYQDGEIETWLAPLLRQSEHISPTEILRHQWKHRDALLMWSLAGGVVLGLVLILVSILQS